MALTAKDRNQLYILVVIVAVAAGAGFWYWIRTPMVEEVRTLQQEIDSLRTNIDSARADLARGTVQQLRDRVAVYEQSLDLMRQLVPTSNEVADLVDQVSIQATLRGVRVTDIEPLGEEYQAPFEVQRYRFTVEGTYDEIGELLSDVASLDRIMVPYDFGIDISDNPNGCPDLQEGRACLAATFLLRTFVKSDAVTVMGVGVSP